MNKKTLSIINAVTFVLMIAVNVISTFGLLGVTPVKDISDKYTNLLVPMGYTFSVIWTVIYAGLLYYTIKELVGKEDKYNINLLFMITNLFNISWIVTFTSGLYLLSCVAIIGLLITLLNINSRITETNLTKVIFSIYTAWILVASIVNITSFVISLNVFAFDSLMMKIFSIVLLLITTIVILMNRSNMAMKLTYLFSLTGIAINHIVKLNSIYMDMMIIVGIVIVYVLYSLISESFSKDSARRLKQNEAL